MSSHRSELDVEALKQQIREEVELHKRTAPMQKPRSLSMGIALRLSHIETLLNAAEAKSQPRTSLPPKFNRFPLSFSRKLPKLALKIYHLMFKEQRAVNASVIQAARESVALSHQLAKDIVELQGQFEQLQARLAALEKGTGNSEQGNRSGTGGGSGSRSSGGRGIFDASTS